MAGCGGTLVSPTKVITAAHCILLEYEGQIYSSQASEISVYVGIHNKDAVPPSNSIRVSSVVTHPQYNGGTFENDIAVVTLAQPIQFNDKIQPACLPDSGFPAYDQLIGKNVVITGWGDQWGGSNQGSDVLRQAKVGY